MAPTIESALSSCRDLQDLTPVDPCCLGSAGEKVCMKVGDSYEGNYTPGTKSSWLTFGAVALAGGVLGYFAAEGLRSRFQSRPKPIPSLDISSLTPQQTRLYANTESLWTQATTLKTAASQELLLEEQVITFEALAATFNPEAQQSQMNAALRMSIPALKILAIRYEDAGQYDNAIDARIKIAQRTADQTEAQLSHQAIDYLRRVSEIAAARDKVCEDPSQVLIDKAMAELRKDNIGTALSLYSAAFAISPSPETRTPMLTVANSVYLTERIGAILSDNPAFQSLAPDIQSTLISRVIDIMLADPNYVPPARLVLTNIVSSDNSASRKRAIEAALQSKAVTALTGGVAMTLFPHPFDLEATYKSLLEAVPEGGQRNILIGAHSSIGEGERFEANGDFAAALGSYQLAENGITHFGDGPADILDGVARLWTLLQLRRAAIYERQGNLTAALEICTSLSRAPLVAATSTADKVHPKIAEDVARLTRAVEAAKAAADRGVASTSGVAEVTGATEVKGTGRVEGSPEKDREGGVEKRVEGREKEGRGPADVDGKVR